MQLGLTVQLNIISVNFKKKGANLPIVYLYLR